MCTVSRSLHRSISAASCQGQSGTWCFPFGCGQHPIGLAFPASWLPCRLAWLLLSLPQMRALTIVCPLLFPLFPNKRSICTVDFIKFLVILQGFPQKVEKPCFLWCEGDIPGCAWFSPSLSAAAASCRRLRAHPLSVPFFRKEIFLFPFSGCSRLYRLVVWWGLLSMGGPLYRARPLRWRPGAGTIARYTGPAVPRLRPRSRARCQGSPIAGPQSSNMICIARQL